MQFKFRDIVQCVEGSCRGQIAQVVKVGEDGSAECVARSMSDGNSYSFKIEAASLKDWRSTGGMALAGPKIDGAPPSPALPPALNPAELLEPLPPEVKAKPMNAERVKAPKPAPKPKPEPYTGPKLPYVFRVDNALGDSAEVTIQIRADLKPSAYKGAAIIMATKIIPPSKPYQVSWRIKE